MFGWHWQLCRYELPCIRDHHDKALRSMKTYAIPYVTATSALSRERHSATTLCRSCVSYNWHSRTVECHTLLFHEYISFECAPKQSPEVFAAWQLVPSPDSHHPLKRRLLSVWQLESLAVHYLEQVQQSPSFENALMTFRAFLYDCAERHRLLLSVCRQSDQQKEGNAAAT